MEKLTKSSVAALLVAVLISFSSCKKEEPPKPSGSTAPADKNVVQPLE